MAISPTDYSPDRSNRGISRRDPSDQWRLWLACSWLVALAIFGGASRADEWSQILVRLAALIAVGTALLLPDRNRLRSGRVPLLFVAVAAALILVTIIPLPAGLWSSLPGRDLYVQLDAITGIGPRARPLALAPDLAINALLALIPVIATILCLAGLRSHQFAKLLAPVLVIVAAGAVLGLLQAAGGAAVPRFYVVSNEDAAVGLFANRNHHAILLTATLPLIAYFVARMRLPVSPLPIRAALAAAICAVAIACALFTGSRSSILLGGPAVLAAVAVYRAAVAITAPSPAKPYLRSTPKLGRGGQIGVIVAAAVGITCLAVLAAFSPAAQRLFAPGTDGEARSEMFVPIVKMAWSFMPFGSGYGSFASVFPRFEPAEALSPNYLNAAHNDLLQIAVEGGAPGLLLLGVGLWAWGRTALAAWRSTAPARLLALAATATSVILLIASLFDYPLRTPLAAGIFLVCLFWMRNAAPAVSSGGGPRIALAPDTD